MNVHRGRAELAHRARIFPAVSLFRSLDVELRHHILVRPEKSVAALRKVHRIHAQRVRFSDIRDIAKSLSSYDKECKRIRR